MSTITFDTLSFTRKLREAGLDERQAEAVVRVIAEAQNGLVTKEHLQIELAPVRSSLDKLTWMIGFNLAFSMAMLWKIFK